MQGRGVYTCIHMNMHREYAGRGLQRPDRPQGKGWSPDGCLSLCPGWVRMRSDGCEMVLSLCDPGLCQVQPANTAALCCRNSKSLYIKGLIMTGSWVLRMHECYSRKSDGIIDDIQLTFWITGTRGFKMGLVSLGCLMPDQFDKISYFLYGPKPLS